jgi:glutamine amidotransferase-like uncharacterized protein
MLRLRKVGNVIEKCFYCIIAIIVLYVICTKEKVIYIYNDGTNQWSVDHAITAFSKLGLPKGMRIKTISPEEIKEGSWAYNAKLLVITSLNEPDFSKDLGEKGSRIIEEYVRSGGNFLGISAGAKYASTNTEIERYCLLQESDYRELRFFKGRSVSPALPPKYYKNDPSIWVAKVYTIFPKCPEARVLYSGGVYFEDADKYPNVKVIAAYENKLPAIIAIRYGKGKVVLTGVNFECVPNLLGEESPSARQTKYMLSRRNILCIERYWASKTSHYFYYTEAEAIFRYLSCFLIDVSSWNSTIEKDFKLKNPIFHE